MFNGVATPLNSSQHSDAGLISSAWESVLCSVFSRNMFLGFRLKFSTNQSTPNRQHNLSLSHSVILASAQQLSTLSLITLLMWEIAGELLQDHDI